MSAAVSADQTMFGDGIDKYNNNNNNNNNGDRESRNNNGTHAFETISESTTTSASSSSIFKSSITTTASNVSRSSSYHLQHLKSAYGASEEMLETEKAGLVERVNDLERIVLEQKDEIVCLKSTLADVLRRLSTIDNSYDNAKNTEGSSHSGSVMSINSSVDEKRFGRVPSRVTSSPSRSMSTAKASSLAQKAIHHSNGSLHSDSMSSHSISPAPSPSPKQPNMQNLSASAAGMGVGVGMGGGMGKRWSSTGDFVSGSPGPAASGTGLSWKTELV
ncbi:AAEL004109-PA [Aedes aegypti]|uniref:AAEL004109-PA n=1 Tax=Aedes aegypti TaxID=7159 RepID=Q17DP9_AEDAE|nr:AAEL004109-PA [Aedes aegypti]